MRLGLALAVAVIASGACGRPERVPEPGELAGIDLALRRGGLFLASQQKGDGAFRSRPYAALRDGWSLTPLAALALRMAPQDESIARAYHRAVDFTATVVVDGRARDSLEVSYPLHAYAIGALVLGAPDNTRHRAAHAVLLARLRAYQLSAANGWRADDPSYGGWGYARDVPVRPAGDDALPDELSANLSATVLAIGALALGGTPADDPALVAARGFVERCQNPDGGLFFSPSVPDANKAGRAADGRFRSYGSTSADGMRALFRLGAPGHRRAAAYLERVFDARDNPGEFPAIDEIRRASSYYYWAWTAAHAARHLDRRDWAVALVAELERRQRIDGSWRNPATEMREDDPVIATSFAMAALALSRSVLAGERTSHAY